jgi:RNA polymerase sigma factor for flagellar operon FliA
MRKRQKQMETATRELGMKLGRTPLEREVAEHLGIDVERWRHMQAEVLTVGPVSASARPDDERDRTEECAAAPDSQPDLMCAHRQLQITLARAMKTLPARYQRVVFLYYTNELTMKEIGELLGVNESRVSQIHKTALKRMATVLQSEGICSAQAF